MYAQQTLKPVLVFRPVPPPTAPPVADDSQVFEESPELADQLERLQQQQTEIDRHRAAELARLRELQDRD